MKELWIWIAVLFGVALAVHVFMKKSPQQAADYHPEFVSSQT